MQQEAAAVATASAGATGGATAGVPDGAATAAALDKHEQDLNSISLAADQTEADIEDGRSASQRRHNLKRLKKGMQEALGARQYWAKYISSSDPPAGLN